MKDEKLNTEKPANSDLGDVMRYGLSKAEFTERERLLKLQRSTTRWFSQEEFDRLKELNVKMFANAGLPHQIITVDRQHTEILDRPDQMWAEGTSIGEGLKPKEQDIQHLLSSEGWVADEIDIWFDNLQGFWRWSCKIVRP